MPTITYQGEHYRLSRSFSDYDEYKESDSNLHPDEIGRVENAIRSVPIAKEFKSQKEFVLAAFKIKFPGYGFGGLDSDSNIYTATIEIPQKDAHRYITAIEDKNIWRVVDDFVGPTAFGGTTVNAEGQQISYKTHEGKEFRRKELR